MMNKTFLIKNLFILILCLLINAANTVIAADDNTAGTSDEKLQNKVEQISELSDKDKASLDVLLNGEVTDFIKIIDDGVLDVDSTIGGKSLTAIAIINNRLGVFDSLIAKGANPNATDARGKSLLILASENVRPLFVEILLKQKGIKTSQYDINKLSAIDYVKDYTVQKAADLKKMSNRIDTPLAIKHQADSIYNRIMQYRANSFIKIEESVFLRFIPESLVPVVRSEFLGRPVWRWLLAISFLVVTFLLNKIMQKYLGMIAEKYQDEDTQEEGTEKPKTYFIASVTLAVRASLKFIVRWFGVYFVLAILAPVVLEAVAWILDVIITYAVAIFFYNLSDIIESFVLKWMDKSELRLSNALSTLIRKSIRVVIVIAAGLHIYSTITGNSITTLVAGLGIGGMAVALAATDTLKNFLGFVTIVTDKPFIIGERVEVKGYDGVVEHIGLRSTRIRRLDGHQVSIPNSATVSDAVRNIERRPFIKQAISVTITYDTPVIKVERAINILKEILNNHKGMRYDFPPRVFFTNMNADNLEIIATFWFFPADWVLYSEFNEWVNLEIMKRFEAEGIEFAFPTQTLYLAGDPNRKLTVAPGKVDDKL